MVQKHLLNLYPARTAWMLSGARRVAMLLLMTLLLTTATAWADDNVSYRYYDSANKVFKDGTQNGVTAITDQTTWGTENTDTWYVVNSNVTISDRITTTGNVHLILIDDYTLTAEKGIIVNTGNCLTIYGQTNGTGALVATRPSVQNDDDGSAGIGGAQYTESGAITIHGGTLTAQGGGNGGAGIGGGTGRGCGAITIYGGTVTATVAGLGAGIGGGRWQNTANGKITISGGTVTASGDQGSAGIGGGNGGSENIEGGIGEIEITGGTIIANTGWGGGAGIGGGVAGSGATISISNAVVFATTGSNTASAIGNGDDAISNSVVTKTSGVIFENNSGQVYGTSFTLTEDLTIPANKTLTIPAGTTLTVPSGVTLTNNGTIANNGILDNDGTLTNAGALTNSGTIDNSGTATNTGTYSGNLITGNGTATNFIIDMTVTDEGVNTTYDGQEYQITVNVSDPASGATITYCETEDGTYTSTNPSYTNAGVYTVYYKVTASGYTDYSGSATVTINPKELTATVTAGNKVYDGTTNATVNATVETGVTGESLTISGLTGMFSVINVGTGIDVTVNSENVSVVDGENTTSANYTISYPTMTTADITLKALTVTANDLTITYGDAPANNGVTYDGFVNGETESVLGGTLDYDYSYTPQNDPIGNYTITPKGLTAANYEITFAAGTLTVVPVPVRFSVVNIASGEELEGAHVQVLDNEGNVVEEWDSTTEPYGIVSLKTGEEYTVHETVAPEGYTIPGDFTLTIGTGGSITFSGTKTENGVLLVENSMTKVKISVVDIATGEELEGAHVQVLDGEENVVVEWDSTTEPHEIVSLRTGEEYTVHETVAPEGYTIPTDFTFTIAEDGTITTTGTKTEDGVLLVQNSMTHVKVSVVEMGSGQKLEDATVQVLDSEENVVEEWTSTTEIHEIRGLKTGEEYTLRETVAPEGYIISGDFTFTIGTGGSITSTGSTTTDDDGLTILVVENSKTKVKISVVDVADGEELEGAHVQVLDGAGNVVEEWDSTTESPVHEIVGLETGEEYTVHETVAPNGYAIPTDFTFTIAEDGSITSSGNTTTDEEGLTVLLVENERTGDLKVTCVLVSDLTADADAEFTFTVTFDDTPISGTFGGMTFTNGVATVTLKGGESATATGLPTSLNYTVSQTGIEGYRLDGESSYSGAISTTTSEVTFTYIQLVNVKVTKVWNDADNQDGKRPDDVTVNLLADGRIIETVTLSEENSWTYTWTNLDKYNGEGAIDYTVTENAVAEYTTNITKADDGIFTYTVTNSHETEETEATVEVVWDDANNQDGIRPESVTVTLSNGTEVTLNEENSWTATVEHLPKYAGGVEIEYTWTLNEEGLPEGYELTDTSVNGTVTTLTNSHTPEETEVKVTKVWDDADNQDGYRPDDVVINLLADGRIIETVTLSEENEWNYSWTRLDKKANGEDIDYTVTENAVAEYTTNITKATDGTFTYTVTNTHVLVTSGYCGATGSEESVTWNYNTDTKTLSISGAGYMMYYNSVQNVDNSYSNGAPWKAFANEIEHVVINNGITYVGSNTFAHCPSISSVTLPTSGIYEIGPGAFGDCTSLESIDIPMSINTIGKQAFAGCSNLATVSIGYGDPGTFTLGSEVFPVTTTILVPESAYENYIKEKAVKESVEIDNPFYGYKDKIVPATRTFFANGTNTWMTWCDVNAWTLPEGCTAYTVSSVSGTTVTLSNALTTIPAYTPVLIQRGENVTAPVTATFSAVGTVPDSGYDSATGIASTTDTEGCTFYGTTTDLATIPEANYSAGLTYVLYGDKFLKSDNNSGIAANRCWLKLEAGGGTSGARLLSIVIDDNPTAIDNVQCSMVNGQSDSWYTIDGRKLDGKPTKKGLYISNGKKVAIK